MKKAQAFEITLTNPFEDQHIIAPSLIEAVEGVVLKDEQRIKMIVVKEGDVIVVGDKDTE